MGKAWNSFKDKPVLQDSSKTFHYTRAIPIVSSATSLPVEFPFLKDYIKAVLNTDLLLVGAKTGSGKTEWLTTMALEWTKVGKSVAFIALEAEDNEIEQRILYKIFVKLYLNDKDRDRTVYFDYRSYRLGLLEEAIKKYEPIAMELFKERLENLHTYYMERAEFNILNLLDLMDDVKGKCDVCIIDHLHYFDFIDDKENALSATKRLMKRIRQLNLESKIPFIVAAHLRKDFDRIMPNESDFHGSSDISKIATGAIMLAPKPDGYNPKNNTAATLVSIPKLRAGGGCRLIAEIDFSLTYQEYLPQYALLMQSPKGDKLTYVKEEDYPRWAQTKQEQWTVSIGGEKT